MALFSLPPPNHKGTDRLLRAGLGLDWLLLLLGKREEGAKENVNASAMHARFLLLGDELLV